MQKRKKRVFSLLGIVVLLALLILLAVFLGRDKTPEASPVTDAGIAYLKSLEQQPPSAVEEELKAIRQAEIQADRDEYLGKLESGELSVWSLFQDYVLLGDSRAEGFGFYEYMSTDRCLAEMGTNVSTTEDHLDQIKALNPSMVFFSYGINDLLLGIWPTPEDYAAEYERLIGLIWNDCPDAKIYINSIIPSLESASSYADTCDLIPTYNAALKDLCDRTAQCYYIDNDPIAAAYPDLYEQDGIHFLPQFYSIWATNMIMEVYDSEIESEDPAA